MKLQRQSWRRKRIAELETELAEIPEIKEGRSRTQKEKMKKKSNESRT